MACGRKWTYFFCFLLNLDYVSAIPLSKGAAFYKNNMFYIYIFIFKIMNILGDGESITKAFLSIDFPQLL